MNALLQKFAFTRRHQEVYGSMITFETCRHCQRRFEPTVRCDVCGYVGQYVTIPPLCRLFHKDHDDPDVIGTTLHRIFPRPVPNIDRADTEGLCDQCIIQKNDEK